MTIKRLSLLTFFVTYILIVFGGFVASSKSGMGCGPDWPLCNGVFIPSLQGATLVEYTHRVIGAVLVVLTMMLLIKVFRSKQFSSARAAAAWMTLLLLFQVLLGAAVVFMDLPAIVITIHLLTAMAFMYCLIWIWQKSRQDSGDSRMEAGKVQGILKHMNVILSLLVLTAGLGAYIKHQFYGLACSWLDCRGSLLPADTGQILQTLHRGLAVVTAFYLLVIAYRGFSQGLARPVRLRLVLAASGVLVQLGAGVMTILTNITISWAVIHLAVATIILALVIEMRLYLIHDQAQSFRGAGEVLQQRNSSAT